MPDLREGAYCGLLRLRTNVGIVLEEDAALYGLAGEIVRTIDPHMESSQVALLLQLMVCFGNMIGRTAHFVAEGSQHFLNLFAVLVGVTSGGRKGSSWAQVSRLFRLVDSGWASNQPQSGLSSGEGLIWAVRDPTTKHEPIREKERVVGYQDVEADPGVSDKRLLVFESEFASPLRMRNAPNGLDRTEISSLFARHKRADEISRALAALQEHGLARVSPPVRDGTGRPSEVWFAIGSTAKEAKERASYFAFFALPLQGDRMGRLLEIAKTGSPEVRPAKVPEPRLSETDGLQLQTPADTVSHPEAIADLPGGRALKQSGNSGSRTRNCFHSSVARYALRTGQERRCKSSRIG